MQKKEASLRMPQGLNFVSLKAYEVLIGMMT